jgi:heptosyltransferase-1
MSSPEIAPHVNDVLFVKTSSLGDVIHHMPALTEAAARRPDARFTWVVEETYAPLVRLHPAAAEVITVAGRSWRKAPLGGATWREIAAVRRALRGRRFDTIIDTQGLLKSAVLARLAQGRRHGYHRGSIKEPMASWLYDVRHRIEKNEHGIARNRGLTGKALGYAPEGPPQFGLDWRKLAGEATSRYGLLLHGTARAEKEWPELNWRLLAAALGAGVDLVVPFGNQAERERAGRIASATSRADVLEPAPLDEMARLLAGASFVVGLDTGLTHLAAALGVPLAAIFCGSDPKLSAPMGPGLIAVLGDNGAPPSVGDVVEAIRAFNAV